MATERICPILSKPENLTACQKNGCMWFLQAEGMQEGRGSCVLSRISFEVGRLNNSLEAIFKKMPGPDFSFAKKV